MYIKLQPAYNTWKRVSTLLNTLWNRLNLPINSPPLLALTYTPLTTTADSSILDKNSNNSATTVSASSSINISSNKAKAAVSKGEMPRTRRRHHSRDRSSGGMRDKRRRVDSEENSPIASDVNSPPRYKNNRSDAKRRRHDSDASSRVSKEST